MKLRQPKPLFRSRPRLAPAPPRDAAPKPGFNSTYAPPPTVEEVKTAWAAATSALSRCVAIVPFMDAIVHHVEESLRGLEKLGVEVRRHAGCSAIDYARSALASQALIDGFESVLFIDSDILFNPADAVRLLLRPEPIVAGLYAQKRYGRANFLPLPGHDEIAWGDQGRDYEVKAVGAGFLRVRREAFQAIADRHQLPTCTGNGCTLWPFFLPAVAQDDSGQWTYLAEDYAFAHLAREAGLKILVDTTLSLSHLGLFPYGWREIATTEDHRPRGGVIRGNVPDAEPA